jgi:hypothetical protein
MSELVIQPTTTAQWHALVSDAEQAAGYSLGEELESYLVFLLMRYTNKPQMLSRVMALDYLKQHSGGRAERGQKLKDVGDHCLLFSGLFPQHAEKRMVKVSYFVKLGRSAYQQVFENLNNRDTIYSHLSKDFVTLMDIMHTMRDIQHDETHTTHLSPIHAFDLWHDTGSKHAYQTIKSLTTHGNPIKPTFIDLPEGNSPLIHH